MSIRLKLAVIFILKFLSIFFWGISIGTKYPSLIPFAAFLIIVALVCWIKTKSLKIFLDKELILKSVTVVAISGGYWYIKNFVIYGNPIYPFLFHCWGKYGADCGQGSSFFGVWTTPINLNTIYPIIKELLPGNVFLYIALIAAPLLIVAFSAKKMRLIAAGATAIFVFEMLALKYSSGFYARYQQHMEFFLILPIALLASVKFKNRLVKIIQYSILALVVISSSIAYFNNLGNLKTFQAEREYFWGKMNIYGWINYSLPKISGAILFCEKPHPTPIPITGFNIGEDAPYIRPYLMNCYDAGPDIQPAGWKNFTKIAEIKK